MREGWVYATMLTLLCSIASAAWGQDITYRESACAKTAAAVHAFNRGDFGTALSLLEEALTIDDTVCEAHFWLARVHAMEAGTNPRAHERAIEHFRRAFELNPYGEMGDLLRTWLYKLMGRPDAVLVLPARTGDYKFDQYSYRTRELLEQLQGQSVGTSEVFTNRETLSPSALTPEYLQQFCRATDDRPAVGWVALVGVYEYEDDRDRKGNPLISAKAKVWIADPVVGFVYEPVVASGSSATLLNLIGAIWKEPPDFLSPTDDWREARERCMNSLAEQVLKTVQDSAVDAYDLELLDEMLVPAPVPGVYARGTTGEYETVCQRPLLAVAATKGEADTDFCDRVVEQLQRTLISLGTYNIVSAANTDSYLAGLSSIPESDEDWATLGRELGATVLCVLEFTPVEISTSRHFLKEKVRVSTTIKVDLLEVRSGRRLHGEELVCRKEKSIMLYGNEDALLRWAASARKQMTEELSNRINTAIGEHIPEPIARETPAVVPSEATPASKYVETITPPTAVAATPHTAGSEATVPQLGRFNILRNVHGYNRGNTVVVPLRGVAEWLGADVEFDNPAIIIRHQGKEVRLTVGSRSASVRGQAITMSVPARVYGGITCVPLRFVGESLGLSVQYYPRAPFSDRAVAYHPVIVLKDGDRVARVLVHGEPPDTVARIIGDLELQADSYDDYPMGSWGNYAASHGWLVTIRQIKGNGGAVWGPTFSRPNHRDFGPTECSDAGLIYQHDRWAFPPGH